jgi:hypothetical protein
MEELKYKDNLIRIENNLRDYSNLLKIKFYDVMEENVLNDLINKLKIEDMDEDIKHIQKLIENCK